MFHVFDRYLLKEVINGWLAVTLFLWLILVSNRLVRYLGDAVSGDIPGNVIFKLIGLKMVWYLVHVVPFARSARASEYLLACWSASGFT